jgi:hypothetical protein
LGEPLKIRAINFLAADAESRHTNDFIGRALGRVQHWPTPLALETDASADRDQ